MVQGIKVCKVCGKEYPYCKNWSNANIFRWQDVACCEEHGQQYFAEILRSRGELQSDPEPSAETSQEEVVKASPKKRSPRSSKESEDTSVDKE